jgi:hypothetical protein
MFQVVMTREPLSPARDGAQRCRLRFERGVKAWVKVWGEGETWVRYVYVPRAVMVRGVRNLREQGLSWSSIGEVLRDEWWELLPGQGHGLFRSEGYGGPGRPYAFAPCRMNGTRTHYMFAQTGGLDV